MTMDVAVLRDFCARALAASGLENEKAQITARVLVEGDLLGHSTHGTALLPQYCDALRANTMTHSGNYSVLNRRAAVELWDGHRLPGPWLVEQAIARAREMATTCGAGTVVIRHSHHIACLAAYLEAPARAGFVTQILSSDAAVAAVAPHGGRTPVMTPNPLAISWPTQREPVIVDVSMSVTAMGLTKRMFEAKQPMPEGWAIDAAGNPTTDAGAIWNAPKGALLPLGSDIAGHKGYALGLMVEALTGGLAGYGRADFDKEWGATIQIQVWDPAAFGGLAAFSRETDFMRATCKASPARPGFDSVRLPGERGLALKNQQLKDGLLLHESITPRLRSLATTLKIAAF
jgi:LDH2 family malate/lactate/ureidoglycolate dehydrogenase